MKRRRKRAVPGSIVAPRDRPTLLLKLHGIRIATEYRQTPQGRLFAEQELERLYVSFRQNYAKCAGVKKQERLRFFLKYIWNRSTASRTAPTVQEAFDRFMASYGAKKAHSTQLGYDLGIRVLLPKRDYPVNLTVPLNNSQILKMEADMEEVILAGEKTNATIDIYLRSVGAFCTWCWHEGYTQMPVRLKRLRRLIGTVPRKRIKIWSEAEITMILAALNARPWPYPLWALIIRFILATGWRIHEVLDLKWNEIKYSEGVIEVMRKDEKEEQYSVITDELRALLTEIWVARENRIRAIAMATPAHRRDASFDIDAIVKGWAKDQKKNGTVFGYARSSANNIRKKLHLLFDEIGIDRNGRSLHELRKTFITRLVQRVGVDMDLFSVARIARCSIAVIQKHYLVLSNETVTRMMERERSKD